MGIIAINVFTTGLTGQSIQPRRCTMISTDSLATITAAGYLNNQNYSGNSLLPTDIFDVLYNFNEKTQVGVYGVFQLTYSSSTGFTLNIWENPGNVLLPVVNNDFANFNGTSGQIKDSGYSPTDATKTKVVMLNATPVVSGRLASYSATNGTLADSGVLASAVQLSANIKAARTANIGGGGAGPISVVVAGLTAASIVVGNIQTSSNPVSIQKITATATGFDILFSGDPGATCTVNYVAFVAAQ